MNSDREDIPPKKVSFFKGSRLPTEAILVGYSALIDEYELEVPRPRICHGISDKHKVTEENNWKILSPRYKPSADLEGHLTFALKHEGTNLLVLKKLFEKIPAARIESLVRRKITGKYSRRTWFLYEWLLEEQLDIDDVSQGNYFPAIDPEKHWVASEGERSRRHRIIDNLPGSREFCPLTSRTEKLEEFVEEELDKEAQEIISGTSEDIVARAASFLLLKDSKASFDIENESPPRERIMRWGRAIKQTGQHELDQEELLRLQKIVIGDSRFVDLGLREEGGFVGERDRRTKTPLPDHISARPGDLEELISGLIDFCRKSSEDLDPVIAAAVAAFGFIYIHPFQDGNGRIHRYLIHHFLSRGGFNPPGLVFPISAVILKRIEEYREVLEDYSRRLLSCIEWEETEDHNVKVLNRTADYYRYFDATPHAEFLYECVEQTIEEELPREIQFLENYDSFCQRVSHIIDMPDKTLDLLLDFLKQNEGKLSKRAREKEFEALRKEEVEKIEKIYAECFDRSE